MKKINLLKASRRLDMTIEAIAARGRKNAREWIISDAAEAVERFGEDELERYAAQLKKNKS